MNTKLTLGTETTSKRAKKSVKKPKRNISAFHIFSKEMHILLNQAAEKVNPNNRMALISEKWANLPPAEKNVYIEKAKLDKWRYLNELNEYLSSGAAAAEPITKTKPKKFGNAFTYFLREKKEELHEEHPELSMAEIMSVVAKQWRGLSAEDKQQYIDASEEDRERYKREVCEISMKAKTVSKSQSRKKLLKAAKNLEKTKNDLIQYSAALNNKGMDFVKKEEYISYQEEFQNPDVFMVYLGESTHKESLDDWVPKIEERDHTVYTVERSQLDDVFEHIVLPKLEDAQNSVIIEEAHPVTNTETVNQGGFMDLFHPEPKRNISKVSDFLPQLSTFSFPIQQSMEERNNKTADDNTNNPNNYNVGFKRTESSVKGRGFLNNVLSSTINADYNPFNYNEFMGNDCTLMTEQSFDRIFS